MSLKPIHCTVRECNLQKLDIFNERCQPIVCNYPDPIQIRTGSVKGKDDIIRHHNLSKSFSEVINRSILFKTCLLSMRRYPFTKL